MKAALVAAFVWFVRLFRRREDQTCCESDDSEWRRKQLMKNMLK